MLCLKTSVTVLHQDICDTLDRAGGDTSATRLQQWQPTNPSIPRVRLAIAQWPRDAPRGAVSTFCAGHVLTQGKNERFHQTLFRYLDKQPLAATLAELQAQVDAFDHIYNTQRPHQGLPGRVEPQTAWEATDETSPMP